VVQWGVVSDTHWLAGCTDAELLQQRRPHSWQWRTRDIICGALLLLLLLFI
jgi:hypothetical protein